MSADTITSVGSPFPAVPMTDPSHQPEPDPNDDTGEFTPVEVAFQDPFPVGSLVRQRYQLLELIGCGGMSRVYRARDLQLGREVAVKLFPSPSDISLWSAELSLRLSRISAQLRHPNVVPVYDSGAENGHPYLVLPFVKGGSLAEQRDAVRTSVGRVVDLMRKVAGAVQYLHDTGILHRDLKPGNILLDGDEPLISDVGIAGWLDEDETSSRLSVVILGNPSYQAPEMMAGVHAATVQSDVWAIGVILYQLLTGSRPFSHDGIVELALSIRTKPPPPFRSYPELTPGTDEALEAVVLKCLEKDPTNRYPSAAALAEDLRRWKDGQRPHAAPRSGLFRSLAKLWPNWFKRTTAPAPATAAATPNENPVVPAKRPPDLPTFEDAHAE